MPNDKKVFYGLSNVHYALLTETESDGVVTTSYGEVKKWPGAVSLTFDPNGNPIIFPADNIAYYNLPNSRGYTGTFECARIPDDVRTDISGVTVDDNGIVVETDKDELAFFALLFQFETDVNSDRYVFYKVALSQRPSVASKTVDVNSDIEIGTETLQFVALPRTDAVNINGVEKHLVKAMTSKATDETAYSQFYSSVYTPSFNGES
jgi:phi13 family phage major tail protein